MREYVNVTKGQWGRGYSGQLHKQLFNPKQRVIQPIFVRTFKPESSPDPKRKRAAASLALVRKSTFQWLLNNTAAGKLPEMRNGRAKNTSQHFHGPQNLMWPKQNVPSREDGQLFFAHLALQYEMKVRRGGEFFW